MVRTPSRRARDGQARVCTRRRCDELQLDAWRVRCLTGAAPSKRQPHGDCARHGRGVPAQRVLPRRQRDDGDMQERRGAQGRRVQSLGRRPAQESAGARGRVCRGDPSRGGRLPARWVGHVDVAGARHHLVGAVRRHVRAPLPEVPVRLLLASQGGLQLVRRLLTAAAAGARWLRNGGRRARPHRPTPPALS